MKKPNCIFFLGLLLLSNMSVYYTRIAMKQAVNYNSRNKCAFSVFLVD